MVVASNEPYSRVSKDNGVFDGALIGSAVAAGGAGAGIFGSRMNYNGIDKRAASHVQAISGQQNHIQKSMDRLNEKGGRVGVVDSIKEKMGNGQINDINSIRNSKMNNLDVQDALAKRMIREEIDPAQQKRANEARQNEYKKREWATNQTYDSMIDQAPGKKWVDDVGAKRQQNYDTRMGKKQSKYDELETHRQSWSGDGLAERKNSHVYSKHMQGGWKKAGIIGASAVIGGGIGMVSDGINK